jgi:hypothetical protein
MIVAAGQVGVDGAMDVKHEGLGGRNHVGGRVQTIGFAALGILPIAHLLAASSFDKFKVGHIAKDIAPTTPLGPRSEMI